MLKKPPDFGGLTHKIRKIVFSYFRCPVFAFLVSRLNGIWRNCRNADNPVYLGAVSGAYGRPELSGRVATRSKYGQ